MYLDVPKYNLRYEPITLPNYVLENFFLYFLIICIKVLLQDPSKLVLAFEITHKKTTTHVYLI